VLTACGASSTENGDADEGSSLSLALCPSHVRFQDYCENAASLPASTKATVDALLATARTQDCAAAQAKLEGLTRLEFFVSGPMLGDLAPLTTLSQLTSLTLGSQKLEDLRPLARLENLETLWIVENDVTTTTRPRAAICPLFSPDTDAWGPHARIDIRPLAHLHRLTSLHLRSDIVHDLRPLAHLEKLSDLDLDCLDFDGNLAPVAGLPQLAFLDLSFTNVRDLSLIPSFATAGSGFNLLIEENPIESLRPLALLPAMTLGGLNNLPSVVRDEAHCPTVLPGMRSDIKVLCVGRNGATPATAAVWLSAILGAEVTEEEARTMTELDLSGRSLDPNDVPFLQGFPALEVLDLSHTTSPDPDALSFAQKILPALANPNLNPGGPLPKVRDLRLRDTMAFLPPRINKLDFIECIDLRDDALTSVHDCAFLFPNATELLLDGNPIGKDTFSCPTQSKLAALSAFCTAYLATP